MIPKSAMATTPTVREFAVMTVAQTTTTVARTKTKTVARTRVITN